MSYSPMQDAHTASNFWYHSETVHIVELWHQAPADISKFKAHMHPVWARMKFYDDTNTQPNTTACEPRHRQACFLNVIV
jgi:hypothetical protein